MRTLLYGQNVDRAAKAKARVGLAILAFTLVYAVIAGCLMGFFYPQLVQTISPGFRREPIAPGTISARALVVAAVP